MGKSRPETHDPQWEPQDTNYNSEDSNEREFRLDPPNWKTTASSRQLEKCPTYAYKRVDLVVPNKRCLIENVSPHRGVNYAHCFPRRFSDVKYENLLTTLEYYWGMKKFDLNLDTRRNILRLGASVHRMFDDDQWMLIPEEPRVIQAFLDSLELKEDVWKPVRAKFPTLTEKRFNYRLIPLSGFMQEITIARQETDAIPEKPSDVTIHIYPFQTLPLVQSHLHPKFVILEAGRKMNNLLASIPQERLQATDMVPMARWVPMEETFRMFKDFMRQNANALIHDIRTQWPVVEDIERIYNAWMVEPEFEKIDKEPDFNNDNLSTRTDDTRETGPRKSKRLNPGLQPTTPTPVARGGSRGSGRGSARGSGRGSGSGRRQKHADAQSSSCSLSGRTLQELDKDLGYRAWTKEAIASWSAESAVGEPEIIQNY